MSLIVRTPLAQRPAYVCLRCSLRQQNASKSQRRFHISPSKLQQNNAGLLPFLEERGFVKQIAGDRNTLGRLLRSRNVGFYAGIDPTAPSLHLGHLLPLMVLFWVSLHGHNAVSLVGGATARVGDPSGRLTSRAKTAENVQEANFKAMLVQTGELWKSVMKYAQRHGYKDEQIGQYMLLNNGEWLDKLNILDFLKTLGNGMRVGTMLGRDT